MSERRLPAARRTVGTIEIELVKLVRYLETLGRRGALYGNVDRAGYIVLRTVDRLGTISINALAEQLHLDASTVTRQVARLEAASLVRRCPASEDRRSNEVSLSAEGARAMRSIEHDRCQMIAAMLSGWTESERHELAEALSHFNLALEDKATRRQRNQRHRDEIR